MRFPPQGNRIPARGPVAARSFRQRMRDKSMLFGILDRAGNPGGGANQMLPSVRKP